MARQGVVFLLIVMALMPGCKNSDDPSPDPGTDVTEDIDSPDSETSDSDSDSTTVEETLQQWKEDLPNDWTLVTEEEYAEYGVNTEPLTEEARTLIEGEISLDEVQNQLDKCLIAEDAAGHMRVRCHESIGWDPEEDPQRNGLLNPCPKARYQLLGYLPLHVPGNDWLFCLEETSNELGLKAPSCPGTMCNPGELCEGMLRHASPISKPTTSAYCVTTEECLTARNSVDNPPEPSCFYNDLTIAEDGVIEEQDCSQLAEGECAVNCPCTTEGAHCAYLSEARPVGVCSKSSCISKGETTADEFCASVQAGASCMHLANPPQWTEDYSKADWLPDWAGDKTVAFALGFCVDTEVCEAHQGDYPGVFNCQMTSP